MGGLLYQSCFTRMELATNSALYMLGTFRLLRAEDRMDRLEIPYELTMPSNFINFDVSHGY
jgi:hypothetical protein